MDNSFDHAAIQTLDLLEARLRRIEYAIGAQLNKTSTNSDEYSVTQRLARLENSLHQLASKSKVIQDLLRLRQLSHSAPL
jgi:hypothetical protein